MLSFIHENDCYYVLFYVLRNASGQSILSGGKKKFICSFGTTVRCLAFVVRGYMVSRALRPFAASATVFPRVTE